MIDQACEAGTSERGQIIHILAYGLFTSAIVGESNHKQNVNNEQDCVPIKLNLSKTVQGLIWPKGADFLTPNLQF